MAYFPTSPTNGEPATVNGITYVYDSSRTAWRRTASSVVNLDVSGNITAANVTVTSNVSASKFYTADGLFWSGNGVAFTSGSGGGTVDYTAGTTPPVSPTDGDFWYKTTNDTLYQYINDGTTSYWIDVQTPSFSANTASPAQAYAWGMSAVFGG
jgi:hypothetical protein